jgi:hypothetical protein
MPDLLTYSAEEISFEMPDIVNEGVRFSLVSSRESVAVALTF